jgi:hypothetical protein
MSTLWGKNMKVTAIDHNLRIDRIQYTNNIEKREEDYRKLVERRSFERIIAERVARNIRLGLDKGQNIDMEV